MSGVSYEDSEMKITRQLYLSLRVMSERGCGVVAARKAVDQMAKDHPEWDMRKRRTVSDWDKWHADENYRQKEGDD